jgi:hypothetical protein
LISFYNNEYTLAAYSEAVPFSKENAMFASTKGHSPEIVDLSKVRNRNEQRVLKALRKILGEMPDYSPDEKDIKDIYALTLNALPARYAQSGTIILRDPVRAEYIARAVQTAIMQVRARPKP